MQTFRLSVLLCALSLVNCIPIPHEQRESPELHGVLLNEGQPAANATVQWMVNPADTQIGCPKEAKSVQTNEKGEFSFPGKSYHASVYPFGMRIDRWRICFTKTNGEQAVWHDARSWGGPARQDLRCESKASADPNAPVCTVKDYEN